MTNDQSIPQVLYIGGLGRSGSTMLERVIGQLPGACGAGEVTYLWDRGIVKNERCGCGEPFGNCPFWSAVGEHAFNGWASVDVDRIQHLASRVDDVKHVPRMLFRAEGEQFRADLNEYVGYFTTLYAGIKAVSGCDIVVDSSKVTSLAYALSHSKAVRLSMAHVVRDPRAVAYSWTKLIKRPEVTGEVAFMPRYSPVYLSALYNGHNLLLEALRLSGVPTVRVRYEDFVDDPATSLARIAALIDCPEIPASIISDHPTTLHLPSTHSVSGNPSRFQTGDIAVRSDDAWRTKMRGRQQIAVGSLTLPTRAMYGYLTAATPEEAAVNAQPAVPEPDVWPTVSAVVPTHNRPELMRRAVDSIIGQDYPGVIETIVVYDRAEPDNSLERDDPRRPVRVMTNVRVPGLAGARNSGIVTSKADLIAFCDDDDHWERQKLRRQVSALEAQQGEFATTAMVVDYEERAIERLAKRTSVSHRELLRSRMAMLHSSSFLARRSALLSGIGLVDETMPQSMAEDWDLLLRAAARRPIVHVDEPLVRVQWGPTSYFADRWQLRNEARLWMLDHHPGLRTDPIAAGLTFGKLAFGEAMLGRRREALWWTRRSLKANWREPRGYLAALVALRLVKGQWIVDELNKRGHGI